MAIDTISLRGRIASASRGALRHVLRSPFPDLRHKGLIIDQLLLSPRDLRTADPSFASEMYHGQFGLAGAVAMTGSESPFTIRPPSRAWERELHGFGWLRHLSAAGDEISREHARAIVRDWLQLYGRSGKIGWQPQLLARRIISWLSHSRIFLQGAEQRFYEDVMTSLTRQVRYLYSRYRDAPSGTPRLTALAALVLAELCTIENYGGNSKATRLFLEELERQILADGGHINRNPVTLIEVLLDILPLRQCFIARDHPPPAQLVATIDRIMPMIRFFRLGDGSLARFNGCGSTPTDNLAAVLAHDDARGAPVTFADQSGYCRLQRGDTVVVIDCGRPPPLANSALAHAGCLAIEMSSGVHPVIVNCGAPARRDADWRMAARATAAHSTLVMSDTSSSQLVAGHDDAGEEETLLIGPSNVTAGIEAADGAQTLRASHDGYDQQFGVTHTRRLTVTTAGDTVFGEDTLLAPHGLKGDARTGNGDYAIRFHVHPAVTAELSADRRTAHLLLPNREGWQLTSRENPLSLAESVYLADNRGPRRTQQIVLAGLFQKGSEHKISWVLEKSVDKQTGPNTPADEEEAPDAGELPLE